MAVTIQCPNPECGTISSVADSITGRSVKCKRCGTPFVARPTLDGQSTDTKPSSGIPAGDPFPSLPAGFGRYRVLKKLGQGGMGAVFLAEDTELSRKVALKLPAFAAGESPQRVERFVREAKASAALQHPNICTVYDAGKIHGRPFISMAFIEGKPLDSIIDADQPLTPERAAELVRDIASGLAHAHAKGIVHRDLKPANIMLTADGDPVVMDFGLAKRLTDAAADAAESKLTQQGAIMGTPTYMAPEQVRGDIDHICPATDVYALGVIFFELLTGRVPFSGRIGVVMGQILHAPAPSVLEFRPDLDPQLAAICSKAMAKEFADRYPDMKAFLAPLDAYLKRLGTASVTLMPQAVIPVAVPAMTFAPPAPVASPFENLNDDADEEDEEEEVRPAQRSRSRTVNRSQKQPPSKRWPLIIGGAVGAFALLVATILLMLRTKHGEIVVELSDPAAKVQVTVDGEQIQLTGLDRPLKLTAGEHGLTVTGPDFETVTQKFTVKNGEKDVLKVTLKPKPAVAKVDPKPPSTTEPKQPTPSEPTPTPLPEPTRPAAPGKEGFIPLFNGQDLTGWTGPNGVTPKAKVENGSIEIVPRGGNLQTVQEFGPDFEFYAEFWLPLEASKTGQARANSGIFLQGRYEIQIIDSLGKAIAANVACGSLYGQIAPTVVASKPPEEWQSYHITFRAPLAGPGGTLARKGELTVVFNGKTIIDRVQFDKTSMGSIAQTFAERGPIILQDHGSPVRFRNLQIRPIPPTDAKAHGESLFKAYPEVLSWKEAKAKCEKLGGRLAIINSEEQNRFVSGGVVAAGLNEAWIGMTDEAEEGKWVWVDGTPVKYTNWSAGQPNNKPPGEHYGLMWVGGMGQFKTSLQWSDQPNIALAPHIPGFVCEWVTPAPAATPPKADAGFVPLFNGKDLTGWKSVGKPTWEWKDGRLLGTPAQDRTPGYLMTETSYSDMEIELEYKAVAGLGSGLFLRADPGGPVSGAEQLEVQICDDIQFAATAHKTGSVFGAFPCKAEPAIKANDWNALRVKLVGRKIEVWVNGTQTVDANLDDARAQFARFPGLTRAAGKIGLQQNQRADVEFRNVRVKDLSKAASK